MLFLPSILLTYESLGSEAKVGRERGKWLDMNSRQWTSGGWNKVKFPQNWISLPNNLLLKVCCTILNWSWLYLLLLLLLLLFPLLWPIYTILCPLHPLLPHWTNTILCELIVVGLNWIFKWCSASSIHAIRLIRRTLPIVGHWQQTRRECRGGLLNHSLTHPKSGHDEGLEQPLIIHPSSCIALPLSGRLN